MGNWNPTPEVFKLLSENDQNETLETMEADLKPLIEDVDIQEQDLADWNRHFRKYSDALGANENQNVHQQIASNHFDSSFGDGTTPVALVGLGVSGAGKAINESQLESAREKLKPKQEAYDRIKSAKDEPVDQKKLNEEIDSLYCTQLSHYENYVDTKSKINSQQKAIDDTNGLLFVRRSLKESKLKDLKSEASDIADNYWANSAIIEKISASLSDEDLARFRELDKKMRQAMGEELSLPQEGPMAVVPPNVPIPPAQNYVKAGSKLTCSFGLTPSVLNVTRTTMLDNTFPMANIMDNKALVNIPTFGMCSTPSNPTVAAATAAAFGVLTPMPCVPNIAAPWVPGKMDVLLEGQPALLNTDTLMCAWGGKITILP